MPKTDKKEVVVKPTKKELALKAYKPLYPELFEFRAQHVCDEYMTTHYNKLIKEPAPDIFTFPFFAADYCRKLIEEAEHHADQFGGFLGLYDEGKTEEDKNYATTDKYLGEIEYNGVNLFTIHLDYINRFLVPIMQHEWTFTPQWYKPTFIARYDAASQQSALEPHNDSSVATVTIVLSDYEDYEGGGTYYTKQGVTLRPPIGHATIFPGKLTHKHGGLALTEGKRYLMVTWMTENKFQ